MARFDASGIDDIVKQMAELGELAGEVADEMLLAGAAEVAEGWKQAAEQYGLKDTGDMINSIGHGRTRKAAGGLRTIDVYPRGNDRKGVRNAEKAAVLHYGTSSIQATRWVDRAEQIGAEPAEKAMREVWEKELRRRGM